MPTGADSGMSPQTLCEHVAVVHEALRRLGFPAEQIFVSPGVLMGDTVCWGVLLRLPTGQQWSAGIAPCKKGDAAFERRWRRFTEAQGDMSDADFKAWWDRHMSLERMQGLTMSIAAKGIAIPSMTHITGHGAN